MRLPIQRSPSSAITSLLRSARRASSPRAATPGNYARDCSGDFSRALGPDGQLAVDDRVAVILQAVVVAHAIEVGHAAVLQRDGPGARERDGVFDCHLILQLVGAHAPHALDEVRSLAELRE